MQNFNFLSEERLVDAEYRQHYEQGFEVFFFKSLDELGQRYDNSNDMSTPEPSAKSLRTLHEL